MKVSISSTLLTRITAWIGLALEVCDAAARRLVPQLFNPDPFKDPLQGLSLLLFLIALVSWLESSNKRLEKLENMASDIHTIAEHSSKIDLIARYGAGAATLAGLLSSDDENGLRFPHCLAGGQTLSELILETYSQTAEQFHRLSIGSGREVTLTESSVINLFLTKLMGRLPQGSIWLGTSKLQDHGAWVKGTAEPAYSTFLDAAERAIKDHGLKYLLVFCFDSKDLSQRMMPIAQHRSGLGVHVRSLVTEEMPEDLSLVWVPNPGLGPETDLGGPKFFEALESRYQPLCGLRFGIRANREVSRMELVGPGDDFRNMAAMFRRSWNAAKDFSDY